MAPKRGTFLLLLIVTCAAMAKSPGETPEDRTDCKDMVKRLLRKCQEKGYPVPKMKQLRTVFNDSDSSAEDKNSGPSNTCLSTFMNIVGLVSNVKGSVSRRPSDDKMTNMMMNCSNLPPMIKQMRNSSEASTCYMRAYLAPMSLAALTTESEDNMDPDDYDTLLWAAKPALQDMSSKRMKFPIKVAHNKLKNKLKILQEVYEILSDDQRTQVAKWAKQQIVQNYFNCSMMPSCDSRLQLMQHCDSSLKWLNLEALTMMGPYLSDLTPKDVDSSPKENLCEFFRSAKFKSALRMATKMNPSLASKLLQRFQECFSREEFEQHVDKLGILACYYYAAPDLSLDLSRNLLSQLNDCDDHGNRDNPRTKKLKKRLVKSLMSNPNITQAVRELGSSVALLSLKNLSMISWKDLKDINKNQTVRWTRGQMRTLAEKQLGNIKCQKVSGELLMALQSISGGLPNCVLKQVTALEILNDTEALKNISKRMRKGQLKAMLHGLREGVDPFELVEKLHGALLCSVPLSILSKAKITSLDQVEGKIWCRSQAAYLVKKFHALKQLQYRRLHSLLQGVTCEMIDKVADSDVRDTAQAIAQTPKWLSKVQVGCAAQKLFATLEKVRPDYFKTITEEEMEEIPTLLLVHLPPSKVKDLPDSVCSGFLDKMEAADLTLLPLSSPSRPALTQRALLCLANPINTKGYTQGTNLSALTTEDMSRLGPLLCELKPSQLRLMAPEVLNSSLQAMASCQHIPQRHRATLVQLVTQTFGDPSDWSAEAMEELGPLILLDDNATSALPNKTWMKDVLYFLKSRLSHVSAALREKIFDLTTTSNAARKKRAANRNGNGKVNTASSTINAKVPTVEFIEELGRENVYWTAKEFDRMSNETFRATVETLGDVSDYSAEQLAALRRKAITALGPVSEMTESVLMQMGCITPGFSNAELEKLPFSLDTLEDIGRCSWNESQIEPVWKAVAKYNNLTAQQLGAVEMVALNRFICGLSSSEIEKLNNNSFKDAVNSMDGVQCSINVTRQLKRLAVSAFGDPSRWTEAEVSDLGNIVAGLDPPELASLNASVFSFISKSCIPLIPPRNLASLSVGQLEALGPDSAAMVTSEQRAALRDDQRAALERTMAGSRDQTQSPGQSGAPSLSIEGISAFMKPLLFLLTGFLLL